MTLVDKITKWFYSTWLGGLYFEFLLWKDRTFHTTRYLSPGEVQQIVRQYSLLTDGVTAIKTKVNDLVNSKSKDEYNHLLKEIEDLVPFADRENDPAKEKLMQLLRRGFEKTVDVATPTDRAKMVDQRINDMYELHRHIEKRNMLRDIRKLRSEGKETEAEKLEKEWFDKYGRCSSKFRRS